jgi:multidrug resistance efflux pump
MTKLSEASPPAADSRGGRNGSLSDRVRSLRLGERASGPARGRGSVLPWGLCAIFLLTALALGYRTYRLSPAGGGTDARPPESAATAPTPATTTTGSVASSGEVALQAKGYVIPAHQIQVSPKISGMLVELHPRFEEGQHFKEGEVLAKLEDVDYKADRNHAKAALETCRQKLAELKRSWPEEIEQAKQELAEQEANLRQLRLDSDRSQMLVRGSALAQRDYEQARYAYEAMDGRVRRLRIALKLMETGPRLDKIRQAEADVLSAEADLAKSQWRLDNCVITAPVTGTILKKNAEKGNMVIPSAFASDSGLSAKLCDMADLSDIEIDLKIQERDIAKVVKDQRCTVMPEAYQNFEPFLKGHPSGYEGTVSRIMPNADRSQGAIPVRVKVKVPKAEEGVYLRPDMGVIVNFHKPVK